MGKFKSHAISCADYVLSQDCEREAVIDDLSDYIDSNTKIKDMKTYVMNSVWYSALVVRDGKRDANKKVTELVRELLDNIGI